MSGGRGTLGALVAFAAGYVLAARSDREELDAVTSAFWDVVRSEEVADLVAAARSHLGHTLRELAAIVDGAGSRRGAPVGRPDDGEGEGDGDLVERVRRLVNEG